MISYEHLTREGFNALNDVGYRSVTVDQLKITFHGIRYDTRYGDTSAPHMHDFF